jgi:pimeloyl-ACP methyl ester carboxylesterase
MGHHREFLEYFFAMCFNEPHSTKQIEDCIGWGLETDPETLVDTTRGIGLRCRTEVFRERCERVRCPVLVIHGDEDLIRPHAQGAALADATGGSLVTLEGSGHIPSARDPVRVKSAAARLRRPEGFAEAVGAGAVARQARTVRVIADWTRPRAAGRGDRQ